eukprot:6189031-Pleurochrysis_carterae.AAC.1
MGGLIVNTKRRGQRRQFMLRRRPSGLGERAEQRSQRRDSACRWLFIDTSRMGQTSGEDGIVTAAECETNGGLRKPPERCERGHRQSNGGDVRLRRARELVREE